MISLNVKWIRLFFVLFAAAWTISDSADSYALIQGAKVVEYFFFMAAIAVGALIIFVNRDKCRLSNYITAQSMVFILSAMAISFIVMPLVNFRLYFGRDLFYCICPAVFAYIVATLEMDNNKDFYIDVLFISMLAAFFINARYTPLSALGAINFSRSYSPYETFGESGTFAVCFIYYMLRKRHIRMFAAGLFAVLTFKRVQVLFVILMFAAYLLSFTKLSKLSIPKIFISTAKVFFMLSPVIIAIVTSGAFIRWYNAAHEQTFDQLTMGRVWQIIDFAKYSEVKLGLGRVNYLLQVHQAPIIPYHNDLHRLYLELTPIGLFVFVNANLNMVKPSRNLVLFLTMCMLLLIMLTSTCIHGFKLWTAMFIMLHAFPATENIGQNTVRCNMRASREIS